MTEHPPFEWRPTVKRRMAVFAAFCALWAVVIQSRLVYLQIIRHGDLIRLANDEIEQKRDLPGRRGEIVDRTGGVLAMSVPAQSVFANPREIEDPNGVTRDLCAIFADCDAQERDRIRSALSRPKGFVWIRRQIDPNLAARIARSNLPGIGLEEEERRYYPKRDLGAAVIGFVNIDQKGQAGLEWIYDGLITGRKGLAYAQKANHSRAFETVVKTPPTVGATLELTIDGYLQHVVETELRAAMDENDAEAGTALIMDPQTGGLLALASYPTFNPNVPADSPKEAWLNRAIQYTYEPGSTFKIVTASAAIEQGVITPDALIDVSSGRLEFKGSKPITDSHRLGVVPFTEVFAHSSNVGTAKVGLKLGRERLIEYARRFGFGMRTSPADFKRLEQPGLVYDAETLQPDELARVAIGYQVAVTPLQMAAAVSSIANGGELLEPRIVRAIVRNGRREPVPRKVIRRTVNAAVAATLTSMMEAVVERGTAKDAQVPGYRIAGKTGTSRKWMADHYSTTHYNASFVGFVPSSKPVFTIVVVIDSPHSKRYGYYGGQVSAPVFKRIAEAALRHAAVPPTLNPPPPLLVRREPAGAHEQPASGPVALPAAVRDRVREAADDGVLPDFTGLSARDAVLLLARLGLQPRIVGTGFVADQHPDAGTALDAGLNVTIRLDRHSAVPEGSAAPR